MRTFLLYLRRRMGVIAMLLAFLGVFALMAKLGGMTGDNILYAAILCALLSMSVGCLDFLCFRRRHRLLLELSARVRLAADNLPDCSDPLEQDYQALARALMEDKAAAVSRLDQKMRDTTAYYTLWAHQIKTPIAAMRLLLQQDGAENTELGQELFRIEQYVDMALQYLRLDGPSSDYVIRRYDLDGIVKQAVRKFAPQFIRKKLALHYTAPSVSVLTDEKWLLFVVEQVLTNALKYTPSGSITIACEPGPALVVSDTGIGIEPEDLPRVFDQGFTGYNGRADKKATGIGLYLCRRVCKKLGHTISITSEVGKGTAVRIGLVTTERVLE